MNFYFRNIQIIGWYTYINVILKAYEKNLSDFINKTSQLRMWKDVNGMMFKQNNISLRCSFVIRIGKCILLQKIVVLCTISQLIDNWECTMDNLPIRWFIDEFRAVRGYDNLRAKPTSRLSVFVANKCSAFQADFWRWFMPQNKFCGYENSAFQAKNTFEYRNPSLSKPSIHRLIFAWKAISFITTGHRPVDKDNNRIPAWKAEQLQLHRASAKRTKQNEIS